jgi:hypothetical protein
MLVWDLWTLESILRRPGPNGSPSFTRHKDTDLERDRE